MTDKAELVDETGKSSLHPKHAPVALPAASFDIVELQKGLDAAVKGKQAERDQNVQAALEAAVADKAFLEQRDPSQQEGYRFVEVKNEQLSELAGEDVIERTQVFDPKLADKAAEADEKVEQQNQATARAAVKE